MRRPVRAAVIGAMEAAGPTAVRDLTPADAGRIARWRYGGRWSVYDVGDPAVFSPTNGYSAVVEGPGGPLVGFVCLGLEARVAGLGEEADLLDVGVGLDPAIVGRGRGRALLAPVMVWAESRALDLGAGALRAVIQSWNLRRVRLFRSLGFVETGRHTAPAASSGHPVEYLVLCRALPRPGADPAAVTGSS